MSEKTRWETVGVLFQGARQVETDEFSGTLKFGLLGELRVWMKPSRARSGKTYWNLICRADELPNLLALGPSRAAAQGDDEEILWELRLAEAEHFEEPEDAPSELYHADHITQDAGT